MLSKKDQLASIGETIAQIGKLLEKAQELYNVLPIETRTQLKDYHDEEYALGYCLEWGIVATTDIIKDFQGAGRASYVVLGETDHGWFADVICDGNHSGKACDSSKITCAFENIICGHNYEQCLALAIKTAKEYDIPLVNEKADTIQAPHSPIGKFEDDECVCIVWKQTGDYILVSFDGIPPEWEEQGYDEMFSIFEIKPLTEDGIQKLVL